MTSLRRACAALGLALLAMVAVAPAATAHRLAPSLLELREGAPGEFEVRFKTPRLRPAGVELQPVLPPHCQPTTSSGTEGDEVSVTLVWTEDCGARGLVGHTLQVAGLAASRTDALVRVELADGRHVRAVLSGGKTEFVVPERESAWDVFRSYVALGFEHILSGFDHLLFVLGLVLLVSGARALVTTITCFTLGHSITLSLAVLGFVNFPSGLVEVAIAASLVFLAAELTRDRDAPPTAMRRWPWGMSLLFGLLHGFGFAGALAEVGLPPGEIPLALLAFNVGIELGQLLFVAVVLAVVGLAGRLLPEGLRSLPAGLSRVPAYGIGCLAAYWCFERVAGLGL